MTTIHHLDTLKTHTARAEYLIRLPDGHFAGFVASIKEALTRASFAEAVVYADRRFRAAWTDRRADGCLPQSVLLSLYVAEQTMLDAARLADAAGTSGRVQ